MPALISVCSGMLGQHFGALMFLGRGIWGCCFYDVSKDRFQGIFFYVRRRRMNDSGFMRMAVELARQGRPSPNPCVGAVIVQEGRVI